ncbi:MAG: peptidylprolyl isomerase, partial [Bacteroidota bacterium]
MKRYLISLFVLTSAFSAYGQGGSTSSKASQVTDRSNTDLLAKMSDSDKPIFKISDASGKNITVYADEFKRQFLKNANLRQKPATEADIQEHLDLYIKFKMKVLDAQLAGLDTNKAYLKELGMYRDQLAKNFLYDRNVTDALIKEAYERLKYEVKVSHILILASPDDSEQKHKAAKDRIDGIYRKLMRNPSAQNFADLAKQESEDPGSSNAGGSLGYMTAMQVVYEFENYAYNTPVGAISTVFKTDFGYHILRVEDKRLNRGDIKMNHIMIRVNGKEEGSEAEAKKRIDDIYNKIISGAETFPSMAQNYSEDYSSRYNNGALDFVRVTQFLGDVDKQNWVDQGFALAKDGDISKPFRTNGGWHILQRMSVKPMGSYDQMKNYLKNEVQKDSRSKVSVDSLVSKIKLANNFRLNALAVSALKVNLDTNFLKGKFDANKLPKIIDVVTGSEKTKKVTKYELQSLQLFKLEASETASGDKIVIFEEYEVADFINYIEKNNR